MNQDQEKELIWAWRIVKRNADDPQIQQDFLSRFHAKVMTQIKSDVQNPKNKDKWYWRNDIPWKDSK